METEENENILTETKENESINNKHQSCTQEIIELVSDGSDIEILQVSSNIAATRRKNLFKRLKQKCNKTKIHVNSVDCDTKNHESFIKEEIIISDASDYSDDEVRSKKDRSNNNLKGPKTLLKEKNKNQNDSLRSIILNCPKCNKTETVFSTTITSICKECKINMWYVCDQCNGRYGSMPALYRHKKLQCKFVLKLPKGKKLPPRKLFLRKCPKCWYTPKKTNCSHKKVDCPNCKITMYYECVICSKFYNSYSGLYRHVKLQCQPSTKTYYCNDCNFNCTNPKNMMRHLIKSHTEIYASEPCCIKCGETFPDESSLRKHKSTCYSSCLQCKLCSYKPKFQTTLRRHLLKYHKDVVNEDVVEDILLAVVKQKDVIKDRALVSVEDKRREKSQLRELRSSLCPKCNVSTSFRLRQSSCKTCGTVVVAQCLGCRKTFKNPTSLYRHIRRQHGSSSFDCDICGRSFRFFGDVNEHRKSCGREPRFECEICFFKTRYKYNLNLHMAKLHNSNRRLYSCAHCGVSYKTSKSIRKHTELCLFNKPTT